MLNFKEAYILENEVALLRPLESGDFDELLYFSLNEPEIWTYTSQPANGKENLTKYLNNALAGREKKDAYPFAVIDKRVNKVVGSTRFYDYQQKHKTTQLGYTWYGKEFQGTGLNKNCKYLMLKFAFEKLVLERVEFRADSRNERSIAAMKSIGCTVEGILRNNFQFPDTRIDSIILSIIKDDWFNSVKQSLKQKIVSKK